MRKCCYIFKCHRVSLPINIVTNIIKEVSRQHTRWISELDVFLCVKWDCPCINIFFFFCGEKGNRNVKIIENWNTNAIYITSIIGTLCPLTQKEALWNIMLNCDKTKVIKKDHSWSTSPWKIERFYRKYGMRICNDRDRVDM